jgi:hypothetical protein
MRELPKVEAFLQQATLTQRGTRRKRNHYCTFMPLAAARELHRQPCLSSPVPEIRGLMHRIKAAKADKKIPQERLWLLVSVHQVLLAYELMTGRKYAPQ